MVGLLGFPQTNALAPSDGLPVAASTVVMVVMVILPVPFVASFTIAPASLNIPGSTVPTFAVPGADTCYY